MASSLPTSTNWRTEIKAADRYDNIENLRKAIEAKGLSSTGTSRKTAIAAETDAYNISTTREAYDIACKMFRAQGYSEIEEPATLLDPRSSGITIGKYARCQHVASGLVSEVYVTSVVALKVITETRNVQPHNPGREVKILRQITHRSIIELQSTFKDQEGRLVLVFPYMPLTLAKIIHSGPLNESVVQSCFYDLFSALDFLHSKAIIHRDIKPSNLLLATPAGPAYLSDFGTCWHPELSLVDEPASQKVLEVGTTCYRAPETLFGNKSYGTSLDMWAAGAMLVECLRSPPNSLFQSRDTSEDGNQLGLILSMFKTLGTPTEETWPEAKQFSTPPFKWYQEFPGHSWDDLLPKISEQGKALVKDLVKYESGARITASKALGHTFFKR